MRHEPNRRTISRLFQHALALAAAGLTALAQPQPAFAAAVELATVPLANSTQTTVKPNVMFVLDDSGSMDWDYLPDTAKNFATRYGFNSSQCNGNYYNPNIEYKAPVNASGAPLNATPTTFTAAYRDGFATGAGTVNLNTGFTGGSGSGSSGTNLPAGPAFFYVYSGAQTTEAQKNYFSTSSTFYQECNSSIGSSPGSGVFTLRRLASTPTTTITVGGTAGGVTFKFRVTGASGNPRVSEVELSDNTTDILSGTTSGKNTPIDNAKLASRIAGKINDCTGGATGSCDVSGYSAAVGSGADDNLVTLTWNGTGSTPPAGMLNIVLSQGSATFTMVQDWSTGTNATDVTSILVGGTQLLSSTASGATPNALASSIQSKILATGFSATVSGAVVTITGPTSASNATPVITATSAVSPAMTLTTLPFPESSATQLQNFANWYSYYSNRMLMMKTGAGLAFQNVTDKFRVGFATMNNNVSPGFLSVDTYSGTQKTNFYTKLYQANPSNSTPLREILSRVGQYYAHKFGAVDRYTSTITIAGTAGTSVEGIAVNGFDLMETDTPVSTSSSTLAQNVTNSINAKVVTDYGATRSGSVITITGPASALGATPVVSHDGGGMTFTPTAFVKTTTTATFNGVTPPDPVQYSCQQNFTILSTDGYWNGPNTYDLNNNPVGNVDGTAARPYNDGAQTQTTYTNTYSRTRYSRIGSSSPTAPCTSNRPQGETPQTGSCTTTVSGGSCSPSNWTDSGPTVQSTPLACITSSQVPATTGAVLTGTVATTGTVGGVANTLADVALYYYQTDLRDNSLANCTGALGTSVCENNVFISGSDNQTQQHMTTFTLGLGVRGRMVYSPSYLTDTTGDFVSVKLGSTASASVCTWQTAGTVCNWPIPTSGSPETTDDLWHAAVNGRGAYFSATDPNTLGNGLSNALVSIQSKVGAAAAAATSTLNPVAGNNQAFVASYTTQKWSGNLEARGINTDTGQVTENALWCVENVSAATCSSPGTIVSDTSGDTTAFFCSTPGSVTCPGGELVGTDCRVPIATACTGTMNAKVTGSTDTRTIKTSAGASPGNTLTEFDTAYRAANPSFFDASVLAGLSQWPPASDVSAAAVYFRANAPGDNMINYLRGRWGHEYDRTAVPAIDQFFRLRDRVLGDALESQPAFIGLPVFSYPYFGYAEFKAAQTAIPRAGTVYMGTNDGMMHAFASDTGIERWAYVPSMVIPNMWKLADKLYADKHTNYVNGSPITTDICTANCNNPVTGVNDPVWKTILVAGLNGGGRGYFALDITVPSTPQLLWEFTPSGGIGKVTDNDLGYTFGQPVVTRKADGTWVVLVTSGYDNGTDSAAKVAGSFVPNSPAGDGKGYLYVLNAATGAIISKISTGVGSASNPSGLAKIAGFNAEPGGNRASYVYGGDLLGNLWRFDINSGVAATIGTGTAFKLAALYSDTAGTIPQPIMTTPILGQIQNKRVVFIGTGKYLEASDLSTNLKQTQYAIKDDDASTTLNNPRTSTLMVQQYLINNPDGSATRLSAAAAGATVTGVNPVNFGTNLGWFVDLPDARERVNIDARLVEGTLLVPSIVPSSTDCSPGGSGWLNFFDFLTGGAVVPQPGLAGVKYDSTIVGINVLFIAGKPVVEVVTSTNPTPTIEPNVQFKATAAGFAGKRVMWRELVP